MESAAASLCFLSRSTKILQRSFLPPILNLEETWWESFCFSLHRQCKALNRSHSSHSHCDERAAAMINASHLPVQSPLQSQQNKHAYHHHHCRSNLIPFPHIIYSITSLPTTRNEFHENTSCHQCTRCLWSEESIRGKC